MELASRDGSAERDTLLGAAPAERADPPHDTQRPRALRLWLLLRRAAREEPLLFQTLAGVAVGIVLGSVINSANGGPLSNPSRELLGLPGELFMRALKCMVIPLIVGSAFGGVLSLQTTIASARGARGIVRRTLCLYLLSMQCAVTIGIVCMSLFRPGHGLTLSSASCGAADAPPAPLPPPLVRLSPSTALLNMLRSCVPPNAVAALASGNVLGLLVLAIATAVAVGAGGEAQAASALAAVTEFNAVVARLVGGILRCTPVGICSLIAGQIAGTCKPLTLLTSLSYFIAVYLLGLLLHAGLVIPTALRLVARVSPASVFRGAAPAMSTVFATDSSSATLPVTLMCCKERLAIPAYIVDFVIPLGTTVNMDGTALYEAVAVLFIAQVHGVQLGVVDTCVVALTATLAAVGAPAIPSAGLVTMLMVLSAVGMDEFAGDIAVLLACDWLLDRCRSVVNVVGDVACCVLVHRLTERAEERERAAADAQLPLCEPQPEGAPPEA